MKRMNKDDKDLCFFKLVDRAGRCNAINDPDIVTGLELLIRQRDDALQKLLEEQISNHEKKKTLAHYGVGLPPSQFDGISDGDIYLGETENGVPFMFNSKHIFDGLNVVIAGLPGSGKTNLVMQFITELWKAVNNEGA